MTGTLVLLFSGYPKTRNGYSLHTSYANKTKAPLTESWIQYIIRLLFHIYFKSSLHHLVLSHTYDKIS